MQAGLPLLVPEIAASGLGEAGEGGAQVGEAGQGVLQAPGAQHVATAQGFEGGKVDLTKSTMLAR